MRIVWPRVFAALLFAVAVSLAIRQRAAIGTFLGSVGHIGPGHVNNERTIGFIALGLVAVCFLAALKILTHNRRR